MSVESISGKAAIGSAVGTTLGNAAEFLNAWGTAIGVLLTLAALGINLYFKIKQDRRDAARLEMERGNAAE